MDGFKAEVISDTHLNMWKYSDEQISAIFPGTAVTGASTLILAGDIGDPDEESLYKAINFARQKYKRVIYVPGNHEFYNREPGSTKSPACVINWFEKLDTQWSNFHFFYRRSQIIDGVKVIGATGWTTSPKPTKWSNLISEEGKRDSEYIEKALSCSTHPALVITHYPSTFRVLQEDYKDKLIQYDYAQDLERLYVYPLNTWVFGHVHQKHDFTIPYSSSMSGSGEVRVICNPYGYPNEGITSALPKAFTVTAKSEVKSLYDTSYQIL